MDLPCSRFSDSSITAASVESTMIGALTRRLSWSRNLMTSAISSRSGSCKHTSSTWAPLRTCRRPISAASSNRSPAIRRLNRRLPSTLVRSPTTVGRVSSLTTTASMPDTRVSSAGSVTRGFLSDIAATRLTDVIRPGAAAPAGYIEPAVGREPLQGCRQHLRRFVVVAVLVGQTRVRHAGNPEPR